MTYGVRNLYTYIHMSIYTVVCLCRYMYILGLGSIVLGFHAAMYLENSITIST